MISQRSIEEVKETAVLSEIIAETVAVQRKGRSVVACCPFHDEKTPSFHIHDDEGYYYCFGCGESGNVISFLMKLRGLSFPDAIEYLAEKYGIVLEKTQSPTSSPASLDQRRRVLRLNIAALEFFSLSLTRAPAFVSTYLRGRRLSDALIKRFSIGYAPDDWHALTRHLLERGASEADVLVAGLARRGKNGDLYDLFRGRLMFPIIGENGRVLAFGGRLVPNPASEEVSHDSPKYVNSPETEVYKKSKTLYGLPYALPEMRRTKSVFLAEGYLDVIGLAGVGVSQVVATCGTALTAEHLQRLSRLVSRVVLLFDGDEAGKKAAARVFPLSLQSSVDIEVALLEPGTDPDDLAARCGERTADQLATLPKISLAEVFLTQLFEELHAQSFEALTPQQKALLASRFCEEVALCRSAVLRDELLKKAAGLLRVTTSVLHEELEKAESKSTTRKGQNSEKKSMEESSSSLMDDSVTGKSDARPFAPFTSLPRPEQILLKAAMVRKQDLPAMLLEHPSVCPLLSEVGRHFLDSLRAIMSQNADSLSGVDRREAVRFLLESLGAGWEAAWKDAYLHMANEEYSLDADVEGAIRAMKDSVLRVRMRELEERIRFCADESEKAALLQEKLEFERGLRRIEVSG